jgi:hypothetical protein
MQKSVAVSVVGAEEIRQDVIDAPLTKMKKKKVSKTFTPRIKVTRLMGNELEGKMVEIVHEADTPSTISEEQEATRAARKKFRYIKVTLVKSMNTTP